MKPEQKEHWITYLDQAIAKRQKSIEQTRQARNNADSPMTSRHDTQRDIFNNDLNMQLDGMEADQRLQKEIVEAEECDTVKPGAYLELDFDGDTEPFLFMNNHGRLPDVDIVTPKSPIGQAIQGKGIGEKAQYRVGNETLIVEIKNIK